MPDDLRIPVTREHGERGECGNSEECAFAEAMKDYGLICPRVGSYILWGDGCGKWYGRENDNTVKKRIVAYDNCRHYPIGTLVIPGDGGLVRFEEAV